ncbi:hypothetical protein [Mucilaginibacter lappiensis]|uniref:hypothetical protein n=1 Tax=Mucilaginibacter lappiensis TaxID=354630 RepID=UPI003D24173C
MLENINTIKDSFTEDFCSHLEYHLTRTFGNSSDRELKWLWCDGIRLPLVEEQLIAKSIIETRQIVTEAWLGVDGQGIYEMTIKFGPRSLEKCIQGLTLNDCLPSEESLDWITLDLEKKEIELQLD